MEWPMQSKKMPGQTYDLIDGLRRAKVLIMTGDYITDDAADELERLRALIRQATEYVEADPLVMGGTAEHAILLDALQRVNKGA